MRFWARFINYRAIAAAAAAAAFFPVNLAFAASTTLIEMQGDAAKPGLATSWKKVQDGKYEFVLNPKGMVTKDKAVTADMVKASLESKLGTMLSLNVTPQGAGKVLVSYKGDEQKFLKKIAKTKIQATPGVELALESSTSDGGFRAKIPKRKPAEDEVKSKVMEFDQAKGVASVLVIDKGGKVPESIAAGKSVRIAIADKIELKKGDGLFFKADAEKDGVWQAREIKQQ